MTRLVPEYTSLKKLKITYRTPLETLLSPVTLPTTEPPTPQIGYTVAETHLPTFSIGVHRPIYVAYLIGTGQFTTAGTLYWRMKKNYVSVHLGSTVVSTNYYYTVNCFFYDVKVGDVLELALWSSVTDSNYHYHAFQIYLTRLIPINNPRLLAFFKIVTTTAVPLLSLGNPSYSDVASHIYHSGRRLFDFMSDGFTLTHVYPDDTYGFFRTGYGDYSYANSAIARTSAIYRPYYYFIAVPHELEYRGVKIG